MSSIFSFRAWSFLVPGFVMIVVGIIIFLFLIVGKLNDEEMFIVHCYF